MPLRSRQIVTRLLSECGVRINGDAPYDIQVSNDDFYSRALLNGSLGLGESYMDGWWDTPDLEGFMYRLLSARIEQRVWTWRTVAGACIASV